ncbi:HNH endonuclease [Glutamicibacter ardleyensis]|uniref:HNH endonuclease n=1 Tax=Glutamicibacter ardleyensis TaxID=225894 RepID=UPI003FD5D0E5
MRWRGTDSGREAFLKMPMWLDVLEILNSHQGTLHTDIDNPLFRDLYDKYPDDAWIGLNNRSFLRDYAAAWVRFGVLQPTAESQGKIQLTKVGLQLVTGAISPIEHFRGYIDEYIEFEMVDGINYPWSPFEIISSTMISNKTDSINEIRAKAERSAPKIFHNAVNFESASVNPRRFRSYLSTLETAGAIKLSPGKFEITDKDYLHSLVRNEIKFTIDFSFPADGLDAESVVDSWAEDKRKERIARSKVREGQKEFRDQTLRSFNQTCSVTECTTVEILEAAHITPYMGRHSNLISNSLCLAADIHKLFDKYLLSVNPESLKIELSPTVTDSRYTGLIGKTIITAPSVNLDVFTTALSRHNGKFLEKLMIKEGV